MELVGREGARSIHPTASFPSQRKEAEGRGGAPGMRYNAQRTIRQPGFTPVFPAWHLPWQLLLHSRS